MHINALSNALGMERRLISYHLLTLEERGFVTSKYLISEEPKSKGKTIRLYTVTGKVAEVKAKLKKGLLSKFNRAVQKTTTSISP